MSVDERDDARSSVRLDPSDPFNQANRSAGLRKMSRRWVIKKRKERKERNVRVLDRADMQTQFHILVVLAKLRSVCSIDDDADCLSLASGRV